MKRIALVLTLALMTSACAVTQWHGRSTAQLTTPGIVALHSLEVVKVLDVVRDLAIDGEAEKIIAVDDARKIVTVHRSILLTIKEAPSGWKRTVTKALEELLADLSPSAKKVVGPYINSAFILIEAVL